MRDLVARDWCSLHGSKFYELLSLGLFAIGVILTALTFMDCYFLGFLGLLLP